MVFYLFRSSHLVLHDQILPAFFFLSWNKSFQTNQKKFMARCGFSLSPLILPSNMRAKFTHFLYCLPRKSVNTSKITWWNKFILSKRYLPFFKVGEFGVRAIYGHTKLDANLWSIMAASISLLTLSRWELVTSENHSFISHLYLFN